MKRFIFSLVLVASLVSSCLTPPGYEHSEFAVLFGGTITGILLKGDHSAKADLQELQTMDHVYAVGTVEDLQGEILVVDSKPYVSSIQGEKMVIDHTFDHPASLLVHTRIEAWQTIQIPSTVSSLTQFEAYVAQAAAEIGINTQKPFPFLIKGTARSVNWHVANLASGEQKQQSVENQAEFAVAGTLTRKRVEILGFHSTKHHGIFTHHGTNIIAHVRAADGSVVGQVDELVLGETMTLYLPRVN